MTTNIIPSVGMAILITKETRTQLSLLNGGVAPIESTIGMYFFFPYSYDSSVQILTHEEFVKRFEFGNDQNNSTFIDVNLKY